MLLGRVVDEDVELAEFGDRLLDHLAANFFLSDIAGKFQTSAAFLIDLASGLLGVAMFVEIRNRDVSAFTSEDDRHGTTDAAVAAGDERNFPVEFAAALIFRPFGFWPRLHFVFAARLLFLFLRRAQLFFFGGFWHRCER